MLPANAISIAGRELRAYLADRLDIVAGHILIGHPSVAAATAEADTGNQYLNIFFHRVEYGGYPADATSEDPFYVRLHCLITALGNPESDGEGNTVTAGENDLRLIGAVLHALHARPTLRLRDEEGAEVAQLQIVPSPLTVDDINNLWSTQTDTSYRLSVAYELALVPIPLARRVERGPWVGEFGVQARPDPRVLPVPGGDLGIALATREVERVSVDTRRADWTPWIAAVDGEGHLHYTQSLSADALPASIDFVAAGALGASVELRWERWDRAEGWRAVAGPFETVTLATATLDPDADNRGLAHSVTIPLNAAGQAVLYAVRRWTRPDGATVDLRSNPVLLTIHEEPA